ncbi:MAG: biotin/lipoyl-binding protein [Candidatus Peribacteraceae bacterium]|nr:biotin/lipoyl-binding protein [Candidatus Peribacteraceae bacterium]
MQRFRVPDRLQPFLRRIERRSFSYGLILCLLLGGSYALFTGDESTDAQDQAVAAVERRTIVTSVKAVGTVTFASEQEMQFNQKGTVARVLFKEGDAVKKGQVIAELDKTTVLADIRQAELSVGASYLQLQQQQSERQQQIIEAENALRETERQFQQAQNSLQVAQEELPSDLEAAQRAVAEKEAALAQAQAELAKTQQTELQSLAKTTQDILADSEKLLDTLYGVLTQGSSARPPRGNYTLDIYHQLFRDLSAKQQVERSYLDAVRSAEQMRGTYGDTLSTQRTPSVLLTALGEAETLAEAVHLLSEGMYAMLQGATTDADNFTVADLASTRTTVSSARSTASALMQSAQTARSNLAAATSSGDGIPSLTLKQKEDAVVSAGNALTQAKANLQLLQTKTPGDLEQQQAAIAKMQEELQSKKAAVQSTKTSVDVNIQLKQNDVAQKSTSLSKTRKTVEDYQLVAPFDGVVRRIDYQVGDNLLDTGEDKSVVLENPDFLIVTIPLDQVDVVRVLRDMPAAIVFDAVPGQTFQGAVDEINPVPIVQSSVVSYEVAVKLATPESLTILSGMTATVEIETARKESVVAVPNLALKTIGTAKTVQKASGETATVTIGVTDGRYTEILSGVQEGESVVSVNVSAAGSATSTNANSAQQLMRMGGGMGGPRGG